MKLSRFKEHHLRLATSLLCALCVAYFYLLDHTVFSSARFSPIFRYLLANHDVKAAWAGLTICLLGALWSRPDPILRCVDFIGRHPLGLAPAIAAVLGFGAIVVYHNYPLSMDEYAAVFQSKVFASGSVVAQLPQGLVDWLVVRGFNGSFLIASPETGRAIEAYWPGFALLLAPFQYLRIPWLCNASLSGLSIFLIYWVTKEITINRLCAGWAMLFTLASGAFIAEGIAYYSMQAHLTANLLFVALLIKPSAHRALAAGLVGSLALNLHNPVPHVLFVLPWVIAMAMQRDQRRHLLPLILGYVPGVVIFLFWLSLRIEIGTGRHDLAALSGIAASAFARPDATMLNMRAAAFVKMFVWAMPGLFLLAFWGGVRHRADPRVRLLACSALLTFIGYVFVTFDQGHGWGYRYFHPAWGVIPILAGCAMTERSQANIRLVSFAGATAMLSLLLIVPFQMFQIQRFVSQHLVQLAPPKRPGNNVYFVHPLAGFYVADMIQSDPLLRDQDLMLVSHGAKLDAQFIRQNWPSAVIISNDGSAEQWYLGAEDQRLPIPGRNEERQFVVVHVPP